jgi:hypothetical protein
MKNSNQDIWIFKQRNETATPLIWCSKVDCCICCSTHSTSVFLLRLRVDFLSPIFLCEGRDLMMESCVVQGILSPVWTRSRRNPQKRRRRMKSRINAKAEQNRKKKQNLCERLQFYKFWHLSKFSATYKANVLWWFPKNALNFDTQQTVTFGNLHCMWI